MKTKQTPADNDKPISPFVPLGSILGKVHESVDRWRDEENRRLAEVAQLREALEYVRDNVGQWADSRERARAALAAADKTAAVVVPAVVVAPVLPDRAREHLQGVVARKVRVPALESEVARLRDACSKVLRSLEWSNTQDRMTTEEQAETLRAALAEGGRK